MSPFLGRTSWCRVLMLWRDFATIRTNYKIDHSEQIAFHPSGLKYFLLSRFLSIPFSWVHFSHSLSSAIDDNIKAHLPSLPSRRNDEIRASTWLTSWDGRRKSSGFMLWRWMNSMNIQEIQTLENLLKIDKIPRWWLERKTTKRPRREAPLNIDGEIWTLHCWDPLKELKHIFFTLLLVLASLFLVLQCYAMDTNGIFIRSIFFLFCSVKSFICRRDFKRKEMTKLGFKIQANVRVEERK